MRAHLYKPIMDISGDLQSNIAVRILQPDAMPEDALPIEDPVFAAKTGATEVGDAFEITNGVIDVWLDNPQYVMLGLTPLGLMEYFIDNVAVLAPFPVVVTGTPTAGQVLTADGAGNATWETP